MNTPASDPLANSGRGGIASTSVLGALDQVVLAGAHFVLAVLVARWRGVEGLAEFTFGYALLVGGSMAHGALIAEAIGASASAVAAARQAGVRVLFVPTAAVAVGMLALVQALALLPGAWAIVRSAGFIGATVASMLLWTCKAYSYRAARPSWALAATGVYAGTLIATMLLTAAPAARWHVPGGTAAFTSIAVAAGAAVLLSVSLWIQGGVVRGRERGSATGAPDAVAPFRRELARYGRWALPAAGLIWIVNNGFFVLMPLRGQASGAAGLRAVLTLLLPLNVILVGASAAVLPRLADRLRAEGMGADGRRLHRTALAAFLAGLPLGIGLMVFSQPMVTAVFGAPFARFHGLLRITAVLPSLWAASVVYRTAIRATGRAEGLVRVYGRALVPLGMTVMLWASAAGTHLAAAGVVFIQVLVLGAFVVESRQVFPPLSGVGGNPVGAVAHVARPVQS